MIKTFESFNKKNDNVLRYHSFDIDDNLIHANTRIKMEHLVDGEWEVEYVSTDKFAEIRSLKDWRILPGELSFEEFRDWGPKKNNTFLLDFKEAVMNEQFSQSWFDFISCLINGHIFSIVTSRGHSPKNVRRAIEWLIYEYGLNNFKKYKVEIENVNKFEPFEDQMINNLLKYHELFGTEVEFVVDQYLDLCPIYTVTSDEFKNEFGEHPVEISKKIALRDFNDKIKHYSKIIGAEALFGFSDDDPKFVKAAEDEFTDLKTKNKGMNYIVFDTSGNKKIKKIIL